MAFMAVSWGVFGSGSIAVADIAVARWIDAHATPKWLRAMEVISWAHQPRGIVLATAAVAGLLAWRPRHRPVLWLLLPVVAGGSALNHLLKHAFMRPRPGDSALLTAASDFSFPSGHVANATLLYGTLAAWVVCGTASRPRRSAAMALATLAIMGVGLSRVMLGAHYPSDVLAAVALGLVWLSLCLIAWTSAPRADRPSTPG
jgi:membrane-associated phospholipid phosphatase